MIVASVSMKAASQVVVFTVNRKGKQDKDRRHPEFCALLNGNAGQEFSNAVIMNVILLVFKKHQGSSLPGSNSNTLPGK